MHYSCCDSYYCYYYVAVVSLLGSAAAMKYIIAALLCYTMHIYIYDLNTFLCPCVLRVNTLSVLATSLRRISCYSYQ